MYHLRFKPLGVFERELQKLKYTFEFNYKFCFKKFQTTINHKYQSI